MYVKFNIINICNYAISFYLASHKVRLIPFLSSSFMMPQNISLCIYKCSLQQVLFPAHHRSWEHLLSPFFLFQVHNWNVQIPSLFWILFHCWLFCTESHPIVGYCMWICGQCCKGFGILSNPSQALSFLVLSPLSLFILCASCPSSLSPSL